MIRMQSQRGDESAQKKTAPDDANIKSGKVEQSTTAVSASSLNEHKEVCQA